MIRAKENRNSVVEYGFTQQKVIGRVNEPGKNYDKMKAIIIKLNDEGMDNRTDIIRLLSTLLSTTESVEKRKEILENDFHISMTEEIEEGLQDMCNYSAAVQNYGERIGELRGAEKAILEAIKNLKETMKWSTKQAMDDMKLSSEAQEKYEKLV